MNRAEAYIRRVQWHKDHAQWFWTSYKDETGREHPIDEVRATPVDGAHILAEMDEGLCIFGIYNGFSVEVFRDGRCIDEYPWLAARWCLAHFGVPGVEDVDFWR